MNFYRIFDEIEKKAEGFSKNELYSTYYVCTR